MRAGDTGTAPFLPRTHTKKKESKKDAGMASGMKKLKFVQITCRHEGGQGLTSDRERVEKRENWYMQARTAVLLTQYHEWLSHLYKHLYIHNCN